LRPAHGLRDISAGNSLIAELKLKIERSGTFQGFDDVVAPLTRLVELRYIGNETDRKWGEGDDISVLEFKTTEYGRSKRLVASEEKRAGRIGINRCARESGFDRKNFIRKLTRGIPVKRNSYNQFVAWLHHYESTNCPK
jgi:hypothetical protein